MSRTARPMIPREHGAWVQLGYPLITALLVGGVTALSLAYLTTATALFLAHEPLLIRLGHRGPRALREQGAEASLRLLCLAATAAILLLVAVFSGPRLPALAALLPLGLGGLTLGFSVLGRGKTGPGELTAAVALSAWLLPVALAGGATVPSAISAFLVWSTGFAFLTASARLIRHQREQLPLARLLLVLTGLAPSVLLALSAFSSLSLTAPLALLPLSLATAGVAHWRPHPRHLRRIGWLMAAASTLSLLTLGVGLT